MNGSKVDPNSNTNQQMHTVLWDGDSVKQLDDNSFKCPKKKIFQIFDENSTKTSPKKYQESQ